MTWYVSSNGDSTKPSALDVESSKEFVFIRKDFKFVEETEDTPAHYTWQELLVRKDDWNVFTGVINNSEAIEDIYAALTELAELIVGD